MESHSYLRERDRGGGRAISSSHDAAQEAEKEVSTHKGHDTFTGLDEAKIESSMFLEHWMRMSL